MPDFCDCIPVNHIPCSVLIVDRDFNVLQSNNAAHNLFGFLYYQELDFFLNMPEIQPGGGSSKDMLLRYTADAFDRGKALFAWMHRNERRGDFFCEISLTKLGENTLAAYVLHQSHVQELAEKLETLQNMVQKDSDTKVYNKEYFLELAEKKLQSAVECNHMFHILMIELDSFTALREESGADDAKKILCIAAKRTRNRIRENLPVAKYDDSKLIVLAACVDHANVLKTAERIRKCIEEEVFSLNSIRREVTVSIGIASNESPGDSLPDIIGQAERALKTAQNQGGNLVNIYESEV